MFVFAKVIPKRLLVPFLSGHGVMKKLVSQVRRACYILLSQSAFTSH